MTEELIQEAEAEKIEEVKEEVKEVEEPKEEAPKEEDKITYFVEKGNTVVRIENGAQLVLPVGTGFDQAFNLLKVFNQILTERKALSEEV